MYLCLIAPVFDAVWFLHSKGFIHSDIKEDNMLVTEARVPKLYEFGTVCK